MPTLTGLSSMATRGLLTALSATIEQQHGISISFTAAGGVEVAQRVREGAGGADVVVLSDDAMASLDADGLLAPATLRPLFVSAVVAAVKATDDPPPLETEDGLRELLLSADRIGFSTGPSGTALVDLLDRWGIVATDRLVRAPPGVPVGTLLAEGRADLGFQQRSELAGVDGVTILGPLPGAASITSTFTGAVLAVSSDPRLAARTVDLLATDPELVLRHGMAPAPGR